MKTLNVIVTIQMVQNDTSERSVDYAEKVLSLINEVLEIEFDYAVSPQILLSGLDSSDIEEFETEDDVQDWVE